MESKITPRRSAVAADKNANLHKDSKKRKENPSDLKQDDTKRQQMGVRHKEIDTLLEVVIGPFEVDEKIASFDLDHTIIKPKSNAKFGQSPTDWVFLYDGSRDPIFQNKIQKLYKLLCLEILIQKCFIFDVPKEVCMHNNNQRKINAHREHLSGKVPAIPIHSFFKNSEKPTMAEGFSEIKTIKFQAGPFDNDEDKKTYYSLS